jgi:hypothetical protein
MTADAGPRSRTGRRTSIAASPPGPPLAVRAITVTLGLGALVYAIVGTETHPWGSAQTLLLLAVAAVLLAVFAVIELRGSRCPRRAWLPAC